MAGLVANRFGGSEFGAHLLEHRFLEELDGVGNGGEGWVEGVAGHRGGAGWVCEDFAAESDIIVDENVVYVIEQVANCRGHDSYNSVAE